MSKADCGDVNRFEQERHGHEFFKKRAAELGYADKYDDGLQNKK